MFSPWPDLQAYQAGLKLNPPSDIGLFVSVAVHNLQDGRSISNQDWDTLLKEACPLLKLKSKTKRSRPYFKLAERCLKRAIQLQSETVKHDEFVASAAKPGILKLKQFFASAPQSVPGASTPAPATTPPQSPTISLSARVSKPPRLMALTTKAPRRRGAATPWRVRSLLYSTSAPTPTLRVCASVR